jgi:hypothetical protein
VGFSFAVVALRRRWGWRALWCLLALPTDGLRYRLTGGGDGVVGLGPSISLHEGICDESFVIGLEPIEPFSGVGGGGGGC